MTIEKQRLIRNLSPRELEDIRRRLAQAAETAPTEFKRVNSAQVAANQIGNREYLERIERSKRH